MAHVIRPLLEYPQFIRSRRGPEGWGGGSCLCPLTGYRGRRESAPATDGGRVEQGLGTGWVALQRCPEYCVSGLAPADGVIQGKRSPTDVTPTETGRAPLNKGIPAAVSVVVPARRLTLAHETYGDFDNRHPQYHAKDAPSVTGNLPTGTPNSQEATP